MLHFFPNSKEIEDKRNRVLIKNQQKLAEWKFYV